MKNRAIDIVFFFKLDHNRYQNEYIARCSPEQQLNLPLNIFYNGKQQIEIIYVPCYHYKFSNIYVVFYSAWE